MRVDIAKKRWSVTAVMLAGCLLAGCSPVFAGFPLGGREEIVFVCDEDSEGMQEGGSTADAAGEVPAESGEIQPEAQENTAQESAGQETALDGKVNLNQASLEELMTLSGIGQTRAQAIIDYRSTQGDFACIEDIMKISGIKEGIFEKIKDQIKVQ